MNRDKLGIFLSFACVIHCMVLPFLAAFLPALLPFAENELAHIVLFALIFTTTGWVFFTGKRAKPVVFFGSIGLVLLGVALAFEGEAIEKYITTFGSVSLILGHFLNLKSKRALHRPHTSPILQ